MKSTWFRIIVPAFCLLLAIGAGLTVYAQCDIGNCVVKDYNSDGSGQPDCWATAYCSTDPDFYDPCGNSYVNADCNCGDGDYCAVGTVSVGGNGGVWCQRRHWDPIIESYQLTCQNTEYCCTQ